MTKPVSLSIEERIAEIKKVRGDMIAVDDIGAIVVNLVTSLDGDGLTGDSSLSGELREILDYISRAKDELHAMRPKTMSEKHIANARDELDAVVAHTEDAASRIMDAADRMSEIASEIDGKNGETLMNLTTEIFEASSFQDITGQRVSKVVGVLHYIEDRLTALAHAIGDTHVHDDDSTAMDESGEVINEDALVHGPQLEGAGNSQDDIDALLASFD